MPRCERCSNSVPSFELRRVKGEEGRSLVVCQSCRGPAEVLGAHPEDKQVAAVSLHQYETADGKKDYRVQAEAEVKGLKLDYNFTFEDAREFFRHGAKKKADLKAV